MLSCQYAILDLVNSVLKSFDDKFVLGIFIMYFSKILVT